MSVSDDKIMRIMCRAVTEDIIENRTGVIDPSYWVYEIAVKAIRDAGYIIIKPQDLIKEKEAIKAWNTRADDWRPIETAPKDGRALLAWNGNPLNYVWMVCWAEEGGWFIPSCGRDGQTHGGYFNSPQFSPTHWKPLPEPPQEKTDD